MTYKQLVCKLPFSHIGGQFEFDSYFMHYIASHLELDSSSSVLYDKIDTNLSSFFNLFFFNSYNHLKYISDLNTRVISVMRIRIWLCTMALCLGSAYVTRVLQGE